METKKEIALELKNQESLFFKIGLAISLLLCIVAFEWKTYYVLPMVDLSTKNTVQEDAILIPITEHIPPAPKPVVMNSHEVIEVPSTASIPVVDAAPVIPVSSTPTTTTTSTPTVFTAPTPEIVDEILDFTEVEAEPIGGVQGFYRYIYGNINPPIVEGIKKGKVSVQFVVEKNGKLSNITIVNSLSPQHDAEVIRVFESAPLWKPATHDGRPARRRMAMDIKFKVE